MRTIKAAITIGTLFCLANVQPAAAEEGNGAYMDATISSLTLSLASGTCTKPSFANRVDDGGGTFWGLQVANNSATISAGFQIGQYLSTTASFQGPVVDTYTVSGGTGTESEYQESQDNSLTSIPIVISSVYSPYGYVNMNGTTVVNDIPIGNSPGPYDSMTVGIRQTTGEYSDAYFPTFTLGTNCSGLSYMYNSSGVNWPTSSTGKVFPSTAKLTFSEKLPASEATAHYTYSNAIFSIYN